MKNLIVLLVSGALIVSGYSQTRNVLVGTNNRVVQPTNFWSADVTNARAGLGLGSAATNPASAFQPSSTVLSNLASSNGAGLTNLTAANITGTVGLASNVTGTIAISNGGSGATTAGGAVTNFFTPNTPLVFATNGQVVANTGTNVLTFTNEVKFASGDLTVSGQNQNISGSGVDLSFEDGAYGGTLYMDGGSIEFSGATNAATTRTNLGLGWSALTNSNAGTGLVSVNTNGEVVSPTNFWQVAPITTTFIDSQPTTNQTTNIAAGRNLHIHSIAPSTVGITNTVALPTTNSFNGDVALVVHQGPTSSVTAVRTAGASTNLITLNQFEEAVEFVYYNSVWQFNHNLSYIEPIFFSDTNAAANAAASRTNLGLPLAALTNTDVTNFRTAIGLGTTNNVAFSNIASSGTLTSTGVVTALSNAVVGGTLTSTGVVTAVTNLNVGGAIAVTNAALTRTNLGLGETNSVTFSALTLSSDLTLGSGDNIVLSTTNGTKIGTATNQLLGFYNQTPITRPSSTGVTTNGFTANGPAGGVHADSRFTGNIGTNAYTISDVVAHLKSLGLLAP